MAKFYVQSGTLRAITLMRSVSMMLAVLPLASCYSRSMTICTPPPQGATQGVTPSAGYGAVYVPVAVAPVNYYPASYSPHGRTGDPSWQPALANRASQWPYPLPCGCGPQGSGYPSAIGWNGSPGYPWSPMLGQPGETPPLLSEVPTNNRPQLTPIPNEVPVTPPVTPASN